MVFLREGAFWNIDIKKRQILNIFLLFLPWRWSSPSPCSGNKCLLQGRLLTLSVFHKCRVTWWIVVLYWWWVLNTDMNHCRTFTGKRRGLFLFVSAGYCFSSSFRTGSEPWVLLMASEGKKLKKLVKKRQNTYLRSPEKEAALVKGLRRLPFTEESRVRIPYVVPEKNRLSWILGRFFVFGNASGYRLPVARTLIYNGTLISR